MRNVFSRFPNLLPCLIPLACATGMLAQSASIPPRLVRATGEASAKAKPDHAQIRVSVLSESPTAQGAAQANARQTAAVIDGLKAAVGKSGELKTTGYSINPQYQYGNNVAPKLIGYRAMNTVLVETDDIGGVGPIIDAAVKAGANEVSGISFTLRDEQKAREQVIAEAAAKARSCAEVMAKALGVRVVEVYEADTASAEVSPRPPMPMMMARVSAQAAPTPVEAGTLDVRATVTVALRIE